MYKILYLFHIFFSLVLIIVIFLQKGSNVLYGVYNYFQPTLYISKKFFFNLSIIFLFLFLLTNFFLSYVLLNSLNYNESNLEFNMLLFSNKYLDIFLKNFEFPHIKPIWWN